MVPRITLTITIIFASLSLSGCAQTITREALLEQLQEGSSPLIVDVRSQGEFDEGHIPTALHISFYSIGSGLSDEGLKKTESVILYCEHGPRASFASMLLYFSGYEHVYALQGHMKGWRQNEYPVEILTR